MTFLERIMQARYPDASVYRNAHNEDWTVSIQVSGRAAMRARAVEGQVELARSIITRLEPKPKPRRRLHWGRRR